MTFLNPSIWIVAIGLLIGSFFSGVSVGKKWEEGRQAIENNHVAEAVDAANTAAAQAIAQIKPKYTTIQNEVQREIRTNTVFADCKLPPDSLRLVNQALNAGAVPAGSSELPTANPPAR